VTKVTTGGSQREVLLIVSVDTEEDNWRPARAGIGVENIREFHRFSRFLDRLGVRATYFTTYQVAICPWAADILREMRDGGGAEIGAHLHPWNTPPVKEELLTRNSMMKNLPVGLQLAKVQHLTTTLEDAFGAAPIAFRAGRFGLGVAGVSALLSCGYQADSSVTPFMNWQATDDGPTFVGAPVDAYRIGERGEITVPECGGPLLEIPLTCGYTRFSSTRWRTLHRVLGAWPSRAAHVAGVLDRLGWAKFVMLSPEGASVRDMLALSRGALEGGVRHLQLFLHSPSLRPGLTPWTSTATEVERLYGSIAAYVDGLSRIASVRCTTIREACLTLGFAEQSAIPGSRGR
jgi:hypothetical protein